MSDRRATVIVCDDILYGITGKAFLQGVYQSDITIPGPEILINQLVFYFTIETPFNRELKRVTLSAQIPGMDKRQIDVALPPIPLAMSERPKISLRAPLLIQQPILRPGRIIASVITESEELDAGGHWIVALSPAAQS